LAYHRKAKLTSDAANTIHPDSFVNSFKH